MSKSSDSVSQASKETIQYPADGFVDSTLNFTKESSNSNSTTIEATPEAQIVDNSTTSSNNTGSLGGNDGSDSSDGLDSESSQANSNNSGLSDDSDLLPSDDPSGLESMTSGGEGGKSCFPGHATVQLQDGSIKTMEDLRIGDKVLVAHPNEYSEVYFFSHQHTDHLSKFISVRTDSDEHSLQISELHLIYINGQLNEAKNMRVGDKLSIAHDKKTVTVISVNRMMAKGLFNPHTLHGDIVVNNIAASTFTKSVNPHVARALLNPFAALYQVMGRHIVTDTANRYALRALDIFFW